ncbi:hypothetical protein [Cellulomonas sp. HZM]|uniref:hypothetical protein n=1 Tax=Cellulomonas sp. HZM TaxID=1454010 RepID=UPI000493334B|nr:hypothetical protein [Cellulomonas sp. HZM]
MVAHILRLKLALLRNGLRRSAWQVVALVLGVVYGGVVLLLVVGGMAGLSVADESLRQPVAVLVGSVLVVAWWVVPLLAFGLDSTVDPSRFVTYAVPRRDLLVGIALAGLVGIPGVMTVVSAVAVGGVQWHDPLGLVAGMVGALAGAGVAVLGSRAATTVALPIVQRRRVREVLAVAALIPLALVGLVVNRLAGSVHVDMDVLDRVAHVLGWTPLGAPWAIGGDVTARAWGLAGARLVITVASLAVIVIVWESAVARSLVNPPHSEPAGRRAGLGWFGRLPATPVGAVAARSLTYWIRDPRYALSVAFVPVVPLVIWLLDRDGSNLVAVGPVTAFLMGWSISADVAYDGSAFWTHLAAPLRGWVDRAGRVIAAATLGVPTALVFTTASAFVTHRVAVLPALLGISLGVLLTGYAAASVVSALVVYPVQQPGESPFQTKQGASAAAMISQIAGWLALVGLCLPEVVLGVVAIRTGSLPLAWATLVVGLGFGGALLAAGIVYGGRALDRQGPALLQRILAFP